MTRHVVAIAGCGRAGSALAAALAAEARFDVRAWDRDPARTRTLARTVAVSRASTLPALLDGARTLLVAVSDDALAAFARTLAAHWPARGPAVALHLAGALPAEVLAPVAARGVACGVFQPVTGMTGPRSAGALRGATATISGGARAVRAARTLARRLGLLPLVVDDAARPLVHAAAVLAAGDLVALLGEAEALLARAGVGTREARSLLGALAAGAVAGFARAGAASALTGPVARGDAATIERHRTALTRAGRRETAALHGALVAAGTRRLAAEGRLDPRTARRLLSVARALAAPYSARRSRPDGGRSR